MTFEAGATDLLFRGPGSTKVPDIKRPGGPLPVHQLFEPQVSRTESGWKEIGVRTPDGQYFPFEHGEKMVFVKDNTSRAPMVRLREGGEVTFSSWKRARQEEIQRAFEKVQPEYLHLYMDMLTEFPELEQIDVEIASSSENAVLGKSVGRFKLPLDDSSNPTIQLNSSAYEAASEMDITTIQEIAKRIGIEPEMLRHRPSILQTYIFLHELGHAYDYVKNYLNNPMTADKSFNPAMVMTQESKHELSTMLIPGFSPSQIARLMQEGKFSLEGHFNSHKIFYWSKGIRSPEKLFEVMQINYRNLPKEKYADDFAVTAIHKNWKKLGFELAHT